MAEQLYKIILNSFTIGTLFLPLLLFVDHLESLYSASTQLNSLHWYEVMIILTLLVIPFLSLKLLQIPWNNTKERSFD
jgi:hypothetical protein